MAAAHPDCFYQGPLTQLVITVTSAGQMYTPLVDPRTGRMDHYMLIKLDTLTPCNSLAYPDSSQGAPVHPEGSTRGGEFHDMSFELDRSLRRLQHQSSLMDVNAPLLQDPACTPSTSGQSWVTGSLPSSPTLKVASQYRSKSISVGGTPSLCFESMPSSFFSPSLSHAHPLPQGSPPNSPEHPPADFVRIDDSMQGSDISWPTGMGGTGIGLGIKGLFNRDGTSFNGLGLLPRTHESDEGLGNTVFGGDDHWGWAHEDQELVRPSKKIQQLSSEPDGHSHAPLARPQDSQILVEILPSSLDSPFCAPSESGNAKRVQAAHNENPIEPIYDDVFLSRSSPRSNPALVLRGPPLPQRSRSSRSVSRPTITSLLKGPTLTPGRDSDKRPAWRP